MPARVVVVSGATGTGKTSLARILAENSTCTNAVHIHSDDFYEYIRKGAMYPWESGTGAQNQAVMCAVAASAKAFSSGGYEAFVDGVIGPWFLEPWIKIGVEGVDVRYVVLRPSEEATLNRATQREQREAFPLNKEIVSGVWKSFSDLGKYEPHVIDTTMQTIQESVSIVQTMLSEGAFRLL